MFVTIFLDIYKNLRSKTFIKPSCPKHPEIIIIEIIEIKNNIICIFTLLCSVSESFHLFQAPKRIVKIKNLFHLLLSLLVMSKIYSIGTRRVKTAFCRTPTYAISVSLMIEIRKNNIDNFTLHYQTVLLNNTFLKFFIKQN